MSERKQVYDAEHPTPADQSAARQRLISQLLESQAEVRRLVVENADLRRDNILLRHIVDLMADSESVMIGAKEQDV